MRRPRTAEESRALKFTPVVLALRRECHAVAVVRFLDVRENVGVFGLVVKALVFVGRPVSRSVTGENPRRMNEAES
jgi:hypothetical protein